MRAALSEHPAKSQDELLAIIRRLGHDRYDPNRPGERYDNLEGRRIDLFALRFTITEDGAYMPFFIEPFHEAGMAERGEPLRVDILIVYDAKQLDEVPHTYEGREGEVKRDGFVFRDASRRPDALRAIVKVI